MTMTVKVPPFPERETISLKMKVSNENLDDYLCIKMPHKSMSKTYPVRVTLTNDNKTDTSVLPLDVDEDNDLTPSVNIDKEIYEWLQTNVTDCFIEGFNIYFKHEEHAVAFKIMWPQ